MKDAVMSQKGSMTRHLVNAQYSTDLLMDRVSFLCLEGLSAPTGLAYCPLGKVLAYKNLIYLLNLQISVIEKQNHITTFYALSHRKKLL